MSRVETIGDATLYLGDCRDQRVAKEPRRKPWGKTPIKEVVACRACLWTWKWPPTCWLASTQKT